MSADPERIKRKIAKAEERVAKLMKKLHDLGVCRDDCRICRAEFQAWKARVEGPDSDIT